MITAAGASASDARARSISQIAMRRIRRSITAMRSGRQRSAVSAMSGSIDASRSTVSRGERGREGRAARRDGGLSSGHCSSKNVSTARVDVGAADLPLIQDLQRRLARAAPAVFAQRACLPRGSRAGPPRQLSRDRRHLDGRRRRFPSLVRGPSHRARQRLLDRSWSSARRTPSARPCRPPQPSAVGRPPRRCSRSAASRRGSGSPGRRPRRTGRSRPPRAPPESRTRRARGPR